jgi:hypothetical protein
MNKDSILKTTDNTLINEEIGKSLGNIIGGGDGDGKSEDNDSIGKGKGNSEDSEDGGDRGDGEDGGDGGDGEDGGDGGDGGDGEHENINIEDAKKISENALKINNILQGGNNVEYNIDYIIEEDEKLINPEKVLKQVDIYIENYNSQKMTNYLNSFTKIYQQYSNKNYLITTTNNKDKNNNITSSKIIVIKNDKTKKIIKELNKPYYKYYNNNNNLIKLKREISNVRTLLLYKYETLTSKLNITLDEKKIFEKERLLFIELLEEYYIYTLYHKKINNISTQNKTNILIQQPLELYKENLDFFQTILNSNIYSIDNNIIDIINNTNIENLTEFNNIISKMNDIYFNKTIENKKNIKDIKAIKAIKDIKDSIKSYIDKQALSKKNNNLNEIVKTQNDTIIDYIVYTLP